MPSPPSSSDAPISLPPLVAAFVDAANSFDLERLMVTFADDALVNDQLRDYWGKTAIRDWAERDIIGERLTIAITKVVRCRFPARDLRDIDGRHAPGIGAGFATGISRKESGLQLLRPRGDCGSYRPDHRDARD
jgi:hypothetical protein